MKNIREQKREYGVEEAKKDYNAMLLNVRGQERQLRALKISIEGLKSIIRKTETAGHAPLYEIPTLLEKYQKLLKDGLLLHSKRVNDLKKLNRIIKGE